MPRSALNPVVHLELHTGDLRGASALYSDLCGWHPERMDTRAGSYLALEMGRRLGGGIVECETRRPVWLPYVEVPDIAAATDRARALGAQVLLDAREASAGWRSVMVTPAGGEFAFWQAKRRTPAAAQRT